MKTFIIETNDANQRLDKFVLKVASGLGPSLMYKYIRKKAIKVNRKKAEISYKLCVGDVVEMYINDEFFQPKSSDFLEISYDPKLNIIYEDENVLLVDKKPGVIVHEDINEKRDTLINQILLYLYKKGEYDPVKDLSFTPSLCNRLDKNTGGIVIVAKNAASQKILYDIVKCRKIKKLYLALVWGSFSKKTDTIYGFLKKDSDKNMVEVRDNKFEDAKEIITKYRVLKNGGDISLVEIDLITGRTHQIRAHMAHIGHAVVGDGKYGLAKKNKSVPFKHQALYAYSLEFQIEDENNLLHYLNGKKFEVNDVYFDDFV